MRKVILALLPLLSLAACAGPVTVGPPWRSMSTWSTLVYATSTGPMLVQTMGQPFAGVAPMRLSEIVAEGMTNRVFGRRTAFTADAARAPHPDKRVVMAFNPAVNASGDELCRGRESANAAPGSRLRVLAAFCDRDTSLSTIQGWVDGVTGPDDGRFAELIAEVTNRLFGHDDEFRQQNDHGGFVAG